MNQQKQFNDAMQLANSINILCKHEGIDANTETLGVQMVLYSLAGNERESFNQLMDSLSKGSHDLGKLFDKFLSANDND